MADRPGADQKQRQSAKRVAAGGACPAWRWLAHSAARYHKWAGRESLVEAARVRPGWFASSPCAAGTGVAQARGAAFTAEQRSARPDGERATGRSWR